MNTRWIELSKIAAVLVAAAGLFVNAYDGAQTRVLTRKLHTNEMSARWDNGELYRARKGLRTTFRALTDPKRGKELSRLEAQVIFAARDDSLSPNCVTYERLILVLNYFEDMCVSYELGAVDRDYIDKTFRNTIPRHEKYFREFIKTYTDSIGNPMWETMVEVSNDLRRKYKIES